VNSVARGVVTITNCDKEQTMDNVHFEYVEGKLHIIVDPTVDLGPSTSGKSNIVAKTGGYGQKIKVKDTEMTVSLNVYTKRAGSGAISVG
jgi:hypothetical protein